MNLPFTRVELEKAHGILVSISKGSVTHDKTFGVCYALVWPSDIRSGCNGKAIVEYYAPLWDEYSGYIEYPVPSPYEFVDAREMFFITDDLWDTNTEYGQARYRLVDHLIKCIENDLNAKD